MADEAKRAAKGGGSFIPWLLVLALFGVVLWLASERNARKWFLTVDGNQLLVGRGRNFPTGTRNLGSGDGELGKAYGPIPVPPGARPVEGEFDDQAALDRALFDQLLPWAKTAADKPDATSQALAMALVERANQLPGLAPAQHEQLGTLRGDLSFAAALGELQLAAGSLESARRMLEQARQNGGRHSRDAGLLSQEIRGMADRLGDAAAGRATASAIPAPATSAPAPALSPPITPPGRAVDGGVPDASR